MMRPATIARLVFAAGLLAASAVPPSAFAQAPSVIASKELGDPQPFQSSVQGRAEYGSWVKHSSPVIADLDPRSGNGPEILFGSQNGDLWVLRAKGCAPELCVAWRQNVGTFIDSSPAVADLDKDGVMEVLVGAGNEFAPQNSGMYAFNADGSRRWFRSAPVNPEGHSVRQSNHVGVFSSPAVGDVSGDGFPDVVYGSFNQLIYVKDRNGNDLPGWERGKDVFDTIWSSPALADFDSDGKQEIILGTDLGGGDAVFGCPKAARGMVTVFDAKGGFLPGWPKCMDTPIWSTPSVQDVNGDGMLDVIVGTNNYIENNVNVGDPWKVYAYDGTGKSLWVSSLRSGSRVFASPAIGDVDGDGKLEVAVATVPNGMGAVWLLDAATGAVRWSKDDRSGQAYIFMGSPVLADVTGDGKADILDTGGDGKLHAWNASGAELFATGLGLHFNNSPAVGDANADGKVDIVAASAVPGSSPVRGKVWLLSTGAGTGPAPWPFYKQAADRRASIGTGKLPPRPGVAAPTPRKTPARKPAATKRAGGSPGATADATTTPELSPSPTLELAAPTFRPPKRTTGSPTRWAPVAAGIALLAAAGGLLIRRRLGGPGGVSERSER